VLDRVSFEELEMLEIATISKALKRARAICGAADEIMGAVAQAVTQVYARQRYLAIAPSKTDFIVAAQRETIAIMKGRTVQSLADEAGIDPAARHQRERLVGRRLGPRPTGLKPRR
jgi:hypothetical protein